uniref:(northern house mosquito) hypothetical protein n=1 Tax=Culex pipiens TaxID=7175 RepID=A0A8D8JBN7_CULPI
MTMNDEQGLPPEVECLLRHRSHPVTEPEFPNPNTPSSHFPPSKFHIELGKLDQIHTFHQQKHSRNARNYGSESGRNRTFHDHRGEKQQFSKADCRFVCVRVLRTENLNVVGFPPSCAPHSLL